MAEILPFMMFEGRALEAIAFYREVFGDGVAPDLTLYGPGEPGPEGTLKVGTFTLAGRRVMASDSFVKHGFTFTPSLSLFVECAGAAEADALFARLSEGGQVLMPMGDYPGIGRFGWTNDRFGPSWQVRFSG